MSLVVCQIEDPHSAKIIRSCIATLGTDGILDTSQLEFVKRGDIFLGCALSKGTDSYDHLIHPSLPSNILPNIWRPYIRSINGTVALPLISAADYNMAMERQKTITRRPETLQHLTISPPIPVREQDTDDPVPTYRLPRPGPSKPQAILIRQLRDFEKPNVVARTWELNLEIDLSLDTSKLTPNKPDDTYYSRASDGEYYTLNLSGLPSVEASYLEYYLQEMPGIALPVLLLINSADYEATIRQQRRVG